LTEQFDPEPVLSSLTKHLLKGLEIVASLAACRNSGLMLGKALEGLSKIAAKVSGGCMSA